MQRLITHAKLAFVEELVIAGFNEEGIEGSEYAAELYYTFRPNAALQFRPNLQYVYRPGGDRANGNVFVLGLKTSASF